ncbi:hypothetical protein [Enterovibrio nigricans]|uniref:TM2 domain-containing membrane protein YozV n=1 Tax=Enterovibrio nigricans DSM 22720 TaxID=1121868 RepID=A0A1T4UUP9_9GAMM|nr:hypothetical protein [Enterovibrio nigricans]PKF50012.1 hypothetical protein AT251_14720 [Enterovibrio nigricans]SKA56400.1 hypothetical protein SAMN02745132_02571 [Enterovibrio nigricans DSM 22720]
MSYGDTITAERLKNQMKNKVLGIFLNFVLPGVGHMYAGHVMKGIITLVVFIVCMFTAFLIVPGIIGFILWLWGMFSVNKDIIAYNDALFASELDK